MKFIRTKVAVDEDLVPKLAREWASTKVASLHGDIQRMAELDHPRSKRRQRKYVDDAIARLADPKATLLNGFHQRLA